MAEQSPKTATPTGVKYNGSADVREITKAQWAKAGVEDQNLVRWSAENGHTVKIEDLNKDALALLEKDPAFETVTKA